MLEAKVRRSPYSVEQHEVILESNGEVVWRHKGPLIDLEDIECDLATITKKINTHRFKMQADADAKVSDLC